MLLSGQPRNSVRTRFVVLIAFTLIVLAGSGILQAQPSADGAFSLIPAGHYIRGRNRSKETTFHVDHSFIPWRELQPHPVRITKPFYMGRHEVTVRQFRAFVEATGYITTAEQGDHPAVGFRYEESQYGADHVQPFHEDSRFSWKNPGFEQTEDHPVVCVSWKDTQEYCRWLSQRDGVRYRLPTEAEWELACKAGSEGAFWWGNDYRGSIHQRCNLANVELEKAYEDLGFRHWFIDVARDPGDGYVFTAPVGTFPANRFGLHDTHGNVWEWCHDTFVETTYREFERKDRLLAPEPAVDPVCEESWNEFGEWRTMRGGSWYNNPATCRADVRNYYEANNSACYLGFRIAHDASEEECQPAAEDWRLEQQATARVTALIEDFRAAGPGGVYRQAVFRETPPVDVTRELWRISFLTSVDFNHVETETVLHAARIPELTDLRINHVDNVTDESLTALAGKTSLQSIILPWGRSQLTSACVPHLTGLTNLRTLEINAPDLTDESLMQLRNLKQLTSLNLSATGTKGGILTSLGTVPLTGLALADLSDEHAVRLSRLPLLKGLTCRGPSLTGRGFAHFAGLKQLKTLNLRGCSSIADADFGPLASLTQLTSLDLNGTQAGDEAMKHLHKLHQLTYLQLGEQITDAAFIDVCAAVSLETIHIATPHLTDAGLRDLWRLKRLNTLNLGSPDTQLTGDGFATLAEATSLRTLYVRSKALTDQAMEHISAMPSLERLYLGDGSGGPPAVTDRGLLMLKDAARLKSVELSLRNTQITDEAIEELKKSNTELSVRADR